MPPQRPKRLPTDFFDRLLSNQTDDQINDLLSSLVDEQIAPTVESENVQIAPYGEEGEAPSGPSLPYRTVEDSIVTRDEELSEPLEPETLSELEGLIPPTARMSSQGATLETEEATSAGTIFPQVPEVPEAVIESHEKPILPDIPPVPEVPETDRVVLPGADNIQVPPELFGEEAQVTDQSTETTSISEIPTVPEEVVWKTEQEETDFPEVSIPDIPSPLETEFIQTPGAEDVEELFGVSHQEPVSPVAEVEQQAVESPETLTYEEPVADVEKEHILTHAELVKTRAKMRQQRARIRKPKLPKLAKPSPPVTVDQMKISALDDYLMTKQREKLSLHLSRVHRAAIWFILPAFITFSLFSWYPMLKGLFLSFFNFQPTGESIFIGFQNYSRAFADMMFWKTMMHAGLFCGMALLLGFLPPLFLSIVINEIKRGRNLIKFLFFLPFLMPTVPAAILWKWIMDQGFGLLNAVMSLLPIADPHIGWLTDPNLAMLSIVLLYIWKNTGWAILIYSVALVNIDPTFYEEAEIQGASIWSKMRLVTLPALRGIIGVMLIITIINTLQLFTEVYIMTDGGPMNSTEVIATYIYKQAFFYMDIGYASALSILMLVMILVITMFRLRQMKPDGG